MMRRHILWLALMICRVAVANPDALNVRDLGAMGDGKTDDTVAFVTGVTRAAEEKRTLYVPRGVYRISKPLALENVALHGPEGTAWPADVDALPVIVPTHRDGPCLELRAGGGARNICIRYEWDKEPEEGPPAILVSGIGALISGVKIQYPWDGIMADGVHNVGRLNIHDVFIVSPRNIGVRVTGTWDVPMLRNIEVWNLGPVPRPLDRGIGFDLGKNDMIRVTDCFVFAMGTGYLLRDKIPGSSIEGGTWGTLTGCAADFCHFGVRVEGENTVTITGGFYWTHNVGIRVDGEKARVRVTGAEVKSNNGSCLEVHDSDHVVVSGCSLLRPMEQYTPPAVHLMGGRTILQGNHIESKTDGIRVGENVRSLVLEGNLVDAGGKSIEDLRPPRTSSPPRASTATRRGNSTRAGRPF